jgi:hypothetical protein
MAGSIGLWVLNISGQGFINQTYLWTPTFLVHQTEMI